MKKPPNLSDECIEKAVSILDRWQNKLTWDEFLKVLSVDLGHKYSKMAMHKHPRILSAWNAAKTRLQSQGIKHGDVVFQQALAKISELQAKLETKERDYAQLLEQFMIWSYNAKGFGISLEQLNNPLPPLYNKN